MTANARGTALRLAAIAGGFLAVVTFAFGAVMLLEGFAVFAAAHLPWLAHFLAMDTQMSPNYDFGSGDGPMVLTAVVSSTLITGLWHRLNCHEPGCPRIGKHHVNGTPWCSLHQHKARPERSTEELLEAILAALTAGGQR